MRSACVLPLAFLLTFACVQDAKDTTRHSATPVAKSAFSDAQLAQLAREALNHTPENVHYEPGAVFKWVKFPSLELEFDFPSKEVDHFPEFTYRLREELAKKYIVYAKQEDIPRELVTGDADRPEFVDGFLFSVTLHRLSPTRIEVKYHDYERYLSSSWQTVEYEWAGEQWTIVRKGSLAVS